MEDKKKYYYESLLDKNAETFNEAFILGLEEYLQVCKIIDGFSFSLDGEEGFIILEEEINFEITFIDNNELEKTIMFTFNNVEDAKAKLKEIKCEYKEVC